MKNHKSIFLLICHLIGLGSGIAAIILECYALDGDVRWMKFFNSESDVLGSKDSSIANVGGEDLEVIRILNMFRRENILLTYGISSDPSLLLKRDTVTEPLAILLLIICLIASGFLLFYFLKYSSFSPKKTNNITIIVSYGILTIALYISGVMIIFSSWMYDDIYFDVADNFALTVTNTKLAANHKSDTVEMVRYVVGCLYRGDSLSTAVRTYMTRIDFCQRSRIKYAAAILALLSSIAFGILFFYKMRKMLKKSIGLCKETEEKRNDLVTPKISEVYSSTSMSKNKQSGEEDIAGGRKAKMTTTEGQQTSAFGLRQKLNENDHIHNHNAQEAKAKDKRVRKADKKLSAHSHEFAMIDHGYPLKRNLEAPHFPTNTETQTSEELKRVATNEGQQTSSIFESKKITIDDGQQTSVSILESKKINTNDGQQTSVSIFESKKVTTSGGQQTSNIFESRKPSASEGQQTSDIFESKEPTANEGQQTSVRIFESKRPSVNEGQQTSGSIFESKKATTNDGQQTSIKTFESKKQNGNEGKEASVKTIYEKVEMPKQEDKEFEKAAYPQINKRAFKQKKLSVNQEQQTSKTSLERNTHINIIFGGRQNSLETENTPVYYASHPPVNVLHTTTSHSHYPKNGAVIIVNHTKVRTEPQDTK